MKYELFYDKYRKTQIIFKEDLISDLVNILDLSEDDAINISNHITSYKINIKNNIRKETLDKIKSESQHFFIFIEQLRNKQFFNKSTVNAIENAYLKLIDDITLHTNGLIIYTQQISTIVRVIGSCFMWESFQHNNPSIVYITEYIKYNMRFQEKIYPKLYNKLLSSVDSIDLETTDFIGYSTKQHRLVIAKRNLLKNTK